MYRKLTVSILLIIIIVLGVIILIKYDLLTKENLVSNKDIIGVIKDALTVVAVLIGGLLTYFKFFSGRTFSTKAEIELEHNIIEKPNDILLHVIKISLVNKGNLTIWNPVAKVLLRKHYKDEGYEEELLENFRETTLFDNGTKQISIVDPGEKTYFIITPEFAKSILFVDYSIEISAKNNRRWQNLFIIENKIEKKASSQKNSS